MIIKSNYKLDYDDNYTDLFFASKKSTSLVQSSHDIRPENYSRP